MSYLINIIGVDHKCSVLGKCLLTLHAVLNDKTAGMDPNANRGYSNADFIKYI